jgi:glycerate dehydrogenase
VDDNALASSLKAGGLKAYCADVMTEEPPKADNPLLQVQNAYLTPHVAWASYEARIRLIRIATDNVLHFINGKPQNVVS